MQFFYNFDVENHFSFYRTCPVCNLPFSDAAFVRYPNGIVTHIKCSKNKTICPVTGKWFGANAN